MRIFIKIWQNHTIEKVHKGEEYSFMFLFNSPLITVCLSSLFSAVLVTGISTCGEKINLRDNKAAYAFVIFLITAAFISLLIAFYEVVKTW